MIVPLRGLSPLWALALLLPAPGVQAKVVRIPMCGGGARTLPLPGAPVPVSDDHDCCRKACHAASDRRKKSSLSKIDCC